MATGSVLAPDQMKIADGTSAIPAIVFASSPRTGLFLKSANVIGISLAGTEIMNISTSGISGTAIVDAAAISTTYGAVKVQKYTIGFAALNTATTGVALLSGTAIAVGGIVVRSFIRVTTSFAGNGDSGSTIKVGVQDQAATGDVHASGALSVYAAGLVEGVSTGTAATMKPVSTSDKQLAVIWTIGGTDTALTAGSMDVYVEWVNA